MGKISSGNLPLYKYAKQWINESRKTPLVCTTTDNSGNEYAIEYVSSSGITCHFIDENGDLGERVKLAWDDVASVSATIHKLLDGISIELNIQEEDEEQNKPRNGLTIEFVGEVKKDD